MKSTGNKPATSIQNLNAAELRADGIPGPLDAGDYSWFVAALKGLERGKWHSWDAFSARVQREAVKKWSPSHDAARAKAVQTNFCAPIVRHKDLLIIGEGVTMTLRLTGDKVEMRVK